MKNTFLLSLLLVFALVSGCNHETEVLPEPAKSDLTVTFKAMYDGKQLSKENEFLYGTWPMQFYTFTLFISDFSLLKGSEEVKLTEVEFMEFLTSSSASNLSATPKFTFNGIPAGEYTGFRLGFGVKPELNAKKPNEFPAGHPLTNEIEYWLGWKSYIFSKIEAGVDISGTPGDYETFLLYHCGSSQSFDVYTEFDFPTPVSIAEGTDAKTVELDLKKLFTQSTGKPLDLNVQDNRSTGNSPTDLHIAKMLMDNWQNAVSLQ